ncbi:MAG: DNA mismatch repair endonuclease MutL [Chthonomonadaceae bacterium]|nr:DNA mismatch repair endonuclease MutL [Chthonomonadaceae bacterium]
MWYTFLIMAIDRVLLLDDNTANRIAAGEVVERPASAVKELVENAIDAGATQITIGLEEGGKTRILISDNGIGMTRNDAILALHRHATSKIKTAEDLFAIRTLGFRGEAIPSIASVSKMTITTKPHDEISGTQISIDGGDLIGVEEVASRDGTTIEVADLFFNTPARLKFLKSNSAELSRALDLIGQLALANPQIGFRVKHGTHEVFSTPGTGEPLAALAAVWGREIAKKMIPLSHENGELKVSGFIATPDISRPGRSHELFYVNGRPIKNRMLGHALEDAVRNLTPDSRYPIATVFIEIPPDLVDVNVHPTKTEVKFTRDGDLHHAVSQAVKTALLAYGIVPTITPQVLIPMSSAETEVTSLSQAFDPMPVQSALKFSPFDAFADRAFGNSGNFASSSSMPEFVPDHHNHHSEQGQDNTGTLGERAFPSSLMPLSASEFSSTCPDPSESGEEVLTVPTKPKPFAEQLREFKVLGQARNTYIIALTPNGIAVVDQHVAHERVLYERLTVLRFSNGIPVQHLAVPLTLNLSRREATLLTEHLETFKINGWDVAPFGGESFVVRSIPAMLVTKPYEKIFRDMVDELINQSVSRRLIVQQEHVTITNACKLAVKAGDPLTIHEMQALLEQLADTENPYLCPHGRPIVVTIGFHELDKQFKRA